MKVLYRICAKSNGKSPVYPEDKLMLVRFCLDSFYRAFRSIEPEMIFILDSCGPEYDQAIEQLIPFKKTILHFENLGNWESFYTQLNLAIRLNDYVLLQEDDYFYLPDTGEKLLAAMKEFDFVTPYDHLDYYTAEWHKGKYEIVKLNHHWRQANSTCLTFGTHSRHLKSSIEVIKKHGIADHPMWLELKELGYELWSPIPTLATHLDKNFLSPAIDWSKIWSKFL